MRLFSLFLVICLFSSLSFADEENAWIRIDVYQFLHHAIDSTKPIEIDNPIKLPQNPIELSHQSTETSQLFHQLELNADLLEKLKQMASAANVDFIGHDAWYQPVAKQPITVLLNKENGQTKIATYITSHTTEDNLHAITILTSENISLSNQHDNNADENAIHPIASQQSRIMGHNELHYFNMGNYLILVSIKAYI